MPTDFLHLDDRAGVDEEARERLGFVEQAAAVLPKIDDDRVDAVGAVLGQDPAAVAGRAHGVLIATEDGTGVAVEGGQADDADLQVLAVLSLGLDDLALGVLFLQLDFLASQLVDPFFLGSVRLDNEPDFGARGPRM